MGQSRGVSLHTHQTLSGVSGAKGCDLFLIHHAMSQETSDPDDSEWETFLKSKIHLQDKAGRTQDMKGYLRAYYDHQISSQAR